jgi:hypothetical protein
MGASFWDHFGGNDRKVLFWGERGEVLLMNPL